MQHQVSVPVAAPAGTVFDVITDLDRLPEWNAHMRAVVEQPPELGPGAEWVVEFRALGQTWRSRSRVQILDTDQRVFEYRSATDDGNPSYAIWTWTVASDGEGALVTVAWDLQPATFWRKVLLGPVRHRQLRRAEVPASIAALANLLVRSG